MMNDSGVISTETVVLSHSIPNSRPRPASSQPPHCSNCDCNNNALSSSSSNLHFSNRLHSLVRSLHCTVAPRLPNSLVPSASTPSVLQTHYSSRHHHHHHHHHSNTSPSTPESSQTSPDCRPNSAETLVDSCVCCNTVSHIDTSKKHLKSNNSTKESFRNFWGSRRRKTKDKNQLLSRSQSNECPNTTQESGRVWRTTESLVPLCTANTASLIFAFYSGDEQRQAQQKSKPNHNSAGQSSHRLARPLDLLSKMTANANDSKYKSYIASVDKALKNFEYTSEWADLVNALAKLNRVLRSNSRYSTVPRRFIVGQRLAQCMHPLLPSGVHLGALETYDLIFKCLGPQRLLSELTIYSNGLFPLLANAAINVRPALLELYETHLLPLGSALRPTLDGFLIGVLPCYEEGSEIFSRTDKLLNQVALGIGGQAYFFDALWRCILYNSSVRLPAITFVIGQYNKKRSLSEQSHILGLCIQTLVKAICASLLDSKILVQRAILDLLLLIFPLHLNLSNEMEQAMSGPNVEENSGKIQPPNSLALPSLGATEIGSSSSTVTRLTVPRKHLKRSELVAIITAALTVLLRRDVSLNRRLQSWFFGADSAGSSSSGQSKSSSSSSTNNNSKSSTSYSSSSSNASGKISAFPSGSQANGDKSSSSCESQSTKPMRKSKKIVYFENYAKSFVIEAFKRCITDPVTAITSVLPASAITNSFISFTLQTDLTDINGDALNSGLMTATSSANHNQRTREVINSSFAISSSSNPESYAMTNSTFWPYRLLICILDQRDLATPILESLYVDILRGLYHEFELLTNVVPPPSEDSDDSPDSPKCVDPDCSLTSFSEGEEDDESLKSEDEQGGSVDKQSYSTHSITDCDDASDTISDVEPDKIRKLRPRSSGTASNRVHRRPTYMRSNSGSSRKGRKLPGIRKLSSSSSSSRRTAIFASAPAVTDVQTESETSPNVFPDSQNEFRAPRAVPGFAVPAKVSPQSLNETQATEKPDSESSEIESDSKKIKENLFTNIRRNVKTKSVTMMRKLRPSSSNKPAQPPQSGQSKMKSYMQTLPLIKQLNTKLSKYEERSVAKKKAKKHRELESAALNAQAINNELKDDASSMASQMPSVTIIEDEKFFSLRHQHYYWNPYYQQLSKSQRKELLKELDRVMHLLITGIGNDFIWSKLATIFDTATSEAISLRKLLRMIIKDVEQYEKKMYRQDSGDVSLNENDDTDAYSDSTDENSENHEESLDCSLTWARKLATTLLNEFIHENQHRNQEKKDESTFYVGEDSLRFDMITGKIHNAKTRPKMFTSTSTTWLKHKILNGLSDRCRECHQPLPYRSPVQPVGTDSITILESCTLVRFLLGDSRPYHQLESIFLGEEDSILNSERSGMLTNSVSSSMTRSSALEPLAVYTSNYHFLILFLERVLQLMTVNAKSFSPVDLGASVELCLALCAKLKPAIMQTFVQRYRLALSEHLTTVRAKASGNEQGEHQTHHRRKSSSGSWFSQILPPITGPKKARTSSTASSKKHLELVKEEEDDEHNAEKGKTSKSVEINDEDLDSNQEMAAVNGDVQLQSVVDGVLNFFTIFVETILLKSDNRVATMEQFDQDTEKGSNLSTNANRLLEFFRDTICSSRNDDEYAVRDRLAFRHQLLPVYERLCELLLEIGTTPVLTSPAIFIKKRQQQGIKKNSHIENGFDDGFVQYNNEVFRSVDSDFKWMNSGKQSNARWFMYLLVLSSDRLSSCSLRHSKNNDQSIGACCQLRQIAMTSLTTVLDLMTISRAYLFRMLPEQENREVTLNSQMELLLSNNDASDWDLFPGTFDARRLNFFPMIPMDMLQNMYIDTTWFSLVAARLWSNLSPSDSEIHYSTIALLQQLHSVSPDSSVCESVFCDEMTGGELSRKYLEYDEESTESYDEDNDEDATFNSYNVFSSHDPCRESIPNDWSNKFIRVLNNDKIYSARAKFQLLFETIREIRFVSERLALIVTGLASAAKIDSELEQDEHVDQFDQGSTITTNNANLTAQSSSTSSTGAVVNSAAQPSTNTATIFQALKQAIKALFDTPGDLVSSELISSVDPTSSSELDRLLRLTTPISPIALCTTLKRHFDRPLFIMLDALARRRNVAEHQAAAADWLLRCLSPFDPFGARNLPLRTSPLLISYYLASGDANSNTDGSSEKPTNDYMFGGFGANTDIGRLLEPLLFILLHPNTNRLSVQNVSIEKFGRRKTIEKRNYSFTSFELREDDKQSSPLKTAFDVGDDDSRIYQISSTSGNVIYHVRKSSPPRGDSIHSSPAVSIREGPSPGLSNRVSPNTSMLSHRFDGQTSKQNKFVYFASNSVLDSMKTDNQMVSEVVEDLVEKVTKSINLPEVNHSKANSSSIPGMAKSGAVSADKSEDELSISSKFEFGEHDSGTQIHCSHLHMHLLLYERQFDSARTIYAFDTLLNMIETWPDRMLYSMATTTFGDIHQLVGASSGHLDGTRVSQIQDLYIRHRNSIQGRGFRPGHSASTESGTGERLDARTSSVRSSSMKSINKKKTKESSKLEGDSSAGISTKSILHNVSLLEMNVQICLWYLRSYYSSCSSDRSTNDPNYEPKSTNAAQRLRELFANIESKNVQSFEENPILQNADPANLIDLESVLGNQRARLMACQLLQIIFQHLSTMMEAFQAGTNLSAAKSKGDSRSFWRKHDSIPSWALNIKAFAHYLHDMLLRCEVQRHVLQCLVTSVWHFKSRKGADHRCQRAESSQSSKSPSSFLYPNGSYNNKASDPAAEVFVSEILNFNDYSTGQNNREDVCDEECGFHEEFEKSLLRLLEQIMNLEHRVSTTTGAPQPTSVFYTNEQDRSSSSAVKLQRFSVELTDLRFDPNVSLAAQPLLHGAIQVALQQDPRKHLAWLALVESSLTFAGKSLSRLVLCVLSQLCCNLDSVVKQIDFSLEPNKKSKQSFTTKHVITTLQSISMLISHCLLDRSQLEPLLACLMDVFDEHDTDQLRNYGLGSALVQNRRRRNRQKEDSNQDSVGNSAATTTTSTNSSSGTVQFMSNLLQNLVTGSGSGNASSNTSSNSGQNATAGSADDTQINSPSSGMSPDSPSLQDARRSILGILNRVIVALFNVWCNLVVVGEDEDELRTNADQWEPNSANRGVICDSIRPLSMCCHYYTKTQSGLLGGYSSAESIRKREHYRQSSCASGWATASNTGWYIMGSAAQIRKNITVLLSILALSNGPSLMSSIAQVWAELRDEPNEKNCNNTNQKRSQFNYLHAPNDLVIARVSIAQRRLVRLISSLNPILPLEVLVQTIRSSMKNASSGMNNRKIDRKNFYIMEISILEFLLAYIRTVPGPILLKNWRSIFILVRDAMTLNVQVTLPTDMLASLAGSSVAQQWSSSNTAAVSINIQPLINFHLLAILHEFLFIAPLTEDRRVLKEMQDIATRLIESIIVSSTVRLTHSRWPFRRNLEVSVITEENDRKNTKKHDSSPNNSLSDSLNNYDSQENSFSSLFHSGSNSGFSGSSSSTGSLVSDGAQAMFDSFFCVKALYALSEFAALVLDVVYPSDEKEKMNPLISNLMNYVVPYLRAHVPHNWACFDACTRLLATLTDYQHTRKAWRKDTLDLLVDSAFFQMPPDCLGGWRTIVDRVMTHDKNTFREFLARIALQNPSTTLNKIFTPAATVRDQEAESKAQLVKRLSFILFCSEKDQYQKYMSEIQEKLIDIHRTSQSALVHAQVLLAFRVIILRMSPQHLASLWPFIYTEMFQVFLSVEQQLLDFIYENDQRFIAGKPTPEKYLAMMSTFIQSTSITPVPTPTSTETREFSSIDDKSTSDPVRSPTNPFKFKQIPPQPNNSGKSSKSPPTPTSSSKQTKEDKFGPKIAPQQLQLLLNACKLLDLALILPSDTLPLFQLHRWTFVGDGTGYQYPNHWFDLGALYSASAHSASNGLDFNSTPTPSLRHQTLDNDYNDYSLSTSHSTGNFATSIDSQDSIGTSDSLSMTSALSSLTESGPSSLGTVSTTSKATLTPSSAHQPFVPHIVLLNSILNYLSYTSVKPIPYSYSTPILVKSQIDSIHDLHSFFSALLARSNRTPTVYTPSDAPKAECINRLFPHLTEYTHQPPAPTQRKAADGRGRARQKKSNSHSSGTNIRPNNESLSGVSVENVSLEELFQNIDRIIANDFLETLSNVEN